MKERERVLITCKSVIRLWGYGKEYVLSLDGLASLCVRDRNE